MSEGHSILIRPPVSPVRMNGGQPILQATGDHSWESSVVLNPAGVLVEPGRLDPVFAATGMPVQRAIELDQAGGACALMYRAQGATDSETGHAPSSLGLALFTPELDLVYRHPFPVLQPGARHCLFGVEDPRCTLVDNVWYLYYTGYTAGHEGGGRVRVCLAVSEDFVHWEDRGEVGGDINEVDNKNAALLPVPVNGKWVLLHRPMAGPGAMAAHWAESEHPAGPWSSRGVLFVSRTYQEFARSWVGAGGPPIHLDANRFLMIYHMGHFTAEETREYDLAAALLDFDREDPVVSRIEPLMRPEALLEQRGDARLGVDNVLFTCANYVWGDDLIIPYAGADSRIFGARVGLAALVRALEGGG